MVKGTTLFDAARRAQETFNRNVDTLVAGFLLRHPDVDPADVELVMEPQVAGGAINFRIEKKGGVKVPAEMVVDPEAGAGGYVSCGTAYAAGWNNCLREVELLNKQPFGQLRSAMQPDDRVVIDV